MMPLRLVCFIAAPMLTCSAQTSSNVLLSNGVQVTISADSGRGSPTALKTELEPAGGNSFYRIFRDQNGLVVYAYQLSVERTPDGTSFRVAANPADREFASRFPNADGGKPVPTLSESRESRLLSSGEKFVVEIPTDPALNEKLTDSVQIQISERGTAASDPSSQSGTKVRFAGLRVSINGQLVSGSGTLSVVSGRVAMFYVPGRGGYFFSTEPMASPAFAQIGVVDHDNLHFVLDGDTFDCQTDGQILGTERGELWVYRDAGYKPVGNWTSSDPATASASEFFTAASDSLKWWLR